MFRDTPSTPHASRALHTCFPCTLPQSAAHGGRKVPLNSGFVAGVTLFPNTQPLNFLGSCNLVVISEKLSLLFPWPIGGS